MTLKEIESRRAEYLIFLEKWILKKDAGFRKIAETEVAKQSKPIRTAGGKNEAMSASVSWWWGDAIWCGDAHTEALEEFLGISFTDDYALMDECGQFSEETFNEVIKRVLPEVYWRHIGLETGDEPTTDEQRAWVEAALEGE